MAHIFTIYAPIDTRQAYVEMDGKRVEGVTSVKFDLKARIPTEVTLTIVGFVDATVEFSETEIIRAERKAEHP